MTDNKADNKTETDNKTEYKFVETVVHIGIAIPDGTDHDGVSLLKAALLCTARDGFASAKDVTVDSKGAEFVVNTAIDRSAKYAKDNMPPECAPLYSMIEASIPVSYRAVVYVAPEDEANET